MQPEEASIKSAVSCKKSAKNRRKVTKNQKKMRFAVKKMQKNTPCKKCVTFERAGGESLVSREAHLVGKRTAGRRELKVKSAKLQEFVVRRNWAGEKAKSLTTYKERRIKKYFPQTQINFCLRASMLNQQLVA